MSAAARRNGPTSGDRLCSEDLRKRAVAHVASAHSRGAALGTHPRHREPCSNHAAVHLGGLPHGL